MTGSSMPGTTIFIGPYSLDDVLGIWCRDGLSVIELDCWWHEISLDYGVVLTASNDGLAARSDRPGREGNGRSATETG